MPSKRHPLAAALLVFAFVAAVYLPFRHVQLRIWNSMSWIDVLAMIALAAPFLAARWALPHRSRATRWAWWLCAILAIDVLAFSIGHLGLGSGHPSLESLISFYMAYAKVVVVPAALAALVTAAWRGEHVLTLILGVCCLAVETVYTVVDSQQPIAWFALLCSSSS